MRFLSLALQNFRSYSHTQIEFTAGLTAIVGPNGQGKTNLLEALGLLAGLGSFRGAVDATMIRNGASVALILGHALGEAERELEIEMRLSRERPKNIKINQQSIPRRRDLLGMVSTTVLSPEDLALVKGEPALRRRWLDDALTQMKPSWGTLRTDLDRVLKQRNAVLRQAHGRISSDIAITLDVWDKKLSAIGDELRTRRCELLKALNPHLGHSYACISAGSGTVNARYVSCSGDTGLADVLIATRDEDLRRGTTTVGPHRDDVLLELDGSPARSHGSQGEQRSLALAMRLAVNEEVRQRHQIDPVLLLDDVFSELDPARAAALLQILPKGQRILTSPTPLLPEGIQPEQLIQVNDGAAQVVSVLDPKP